MSVCSDLCDAVSAAAAEAVPASAKVFAGNQPGSFFAAYVYHGVGTGTSRWARLT
jgi:hypothetical protein